MPDMRTHEFVEFWRRHPTTGKGTLARHPADALAWPKGLGFLDRPELSLRDKWVREHHARINPEAVDDSFFPVPVLGDLAMASLVLLLDAPQLLNGDHESEWPGTETRRMRVLNMQQRFVRACPRVPFFPLDPKEFGSIQQHHWMDPSPGHQGFGRLIRHLAEVFDRPAKNVQYRLAAHVTVLFAFPYRRKCGRFPEGVELPSMRMARGAARAFVSSAMEGKGIVINASSPGAWGEQLVSSEHPSGSWVHPNVWGYNRSDDPGSRPPALACEELLVGLAERLKGDIRMFGPTFFYRARRS